MLTLVLQLALGADDVLADSLGVADLAVTAVGIARALVLVDSLADAPVGANLAALAVPVVLAVGEDNLLAEAVVVADFAMGAVLVVVAVGSGLDLTSLLVASGAGNGLTPAVGVAHVAILAVSAALALVASRGVLADGLGAAVAVLRAMVVVGATLPLAVVRILLPRLIVSLALACGILVSGVRAPALVVIPFLAAVLGVPLVLALVAGLRVGERRRGGTADDLSPLALQVDVLQVDQDSAGDDNGRGQPLAVIVVITIPLVAGRRRYRPNGCRR
jgi:hypothetical protein